MLTEKECVALVMNLAMYVNKSKIKCDLSKDPFVYLFNYDHTEEKEDYLNCDHIVIQSEDCLDVLFVPTRINYLFLFHHLCGIIA